MPHRLTLGLLAIVALSLSSCSPVGNAFPPPGVTMPLYQNRHIAGATLGIAMPAEPAELHVAAAEDSAVARGAASFQAFFLEALRDSLHARSTFSDVSVQAEGAAPATVEYPLKATRTGEAREYAVPAEGATLTIGGATPDFVMVFSEVSLSRRIGSTVWVPGAPGMPPKGQGTPPGAVGTVRYVIWDTARNMVVTYGTLFDWVTTKSVKEAENLDTWRKLAGEFADRMVKDSPFAPGA